MEEKEQEKYLGDVVSNDGRNIKNIKARVSKGKGIISRIMTYLDGIPFGKFYFESLDLFSEEREEFFDRRRGSQFITNQFKPLEIEDEIEENSVLINL